MIKEEHNFERNFVKTFFSSQASYLEKFKDLLIKTIEETKLYMITAKNADAELKKM